MASVKSPDSRTSVMSKPWNTQSLAPRITSDITAALCSSTLVAPLITLIDKSIILRTHKSASLSEIFASNLRTALRHPIGFFTTAPFILINTLYFATYCTANITDTVTSTVRNKPPSAVTAGPAKFFATSTANLSICMYKDARFAKMFGAGASNAVRSATQSAAKATKVVPMTSLALFAARDSMTMFASFNVPAMLGPMIGSMAAAQFIAPASIQFLSTPLHLFGLDLYNRPRQGSDLLWSDRWKAVKRDWFHASLGRVCRIVPAYGLGGVVNTAVRKRFMKTLE